MATDNEVLSLLGIPFPPFAEKPHRCDHCGGIWRVAGTWHPDGQVGAYVILQCDGCGAMQNGGAP